MHEEFKTEHQEETLLGKNLTPFSGIIKAINDRFGTEWDEGDKPFLEQMVESLMKDEVLTEQARANAYGAFKNAGEKKVMGVFVDMAQQSTGKSAELLKSKEMRSFIFDRVLQEMYGHAHTFQ